MYFLDKLYCQGSRFVRVVAMFIATKLTSFLCIHSVNGRHIGINFSRAGHRDDKKMQIQGELRCILL